MELFALKMFFDIFFFVCEKVMRNLGSAMRLSGGGIMVDRDVGEMGVAYQISIMK